MSRNSSLDGYSFTGLWLLPTEPRSPLHYLRFKTLKLPGLEVIRFYLVACTKNQLMLYVDLPLLGSEGIGLKSAYRPKIFARAITSRYAHSDGGR